MEIKKNNIYLGDCYKLIEAIPDRSVNIIYTDVPYLYMESHSEGGSEIHRRVNKTADELKRNNIADGFDYAIFNEFVRIQPKINCFIWCSKLQLLDIANWFMAWSSQNNRPVFFELLVWAKTNPIPSTNNKWLSDLEYCLYFRESGVKLNDGYENKHKFYVSGINKSDKDEYLHPTCKPLSFVEKNLKNVAKKGDLVLDPFLGSGTTTIACKHLGLDYIGFEINPDYFKIAKDRMEGVNQKGELNLFDIEY